MASDYTTQPEQSNLPTTTRTTAPMPPSRSIVGMFHNARNNNFHNTSFVTNVKEAPSLDKLYNRVAPHAILNAGGRADEVRCHPGTREEVIDRIEKWADALDGQTAPIFWLSGPAGAGKSAVMQTIAERRDQSGVPQANFFFFRGDASRCHSPPLVPTLLHQIILNNPYLRETAATMLSSNPLIFDSTLEDQLTYLIAILLHANQQSTSAYRPLILLIDGLDECNSETKASQQEIILAFDKLFTQRPTVCPFRLLVASRDKSQIQVAFNKFSSECINLYLDDKYSPANDIRVFVNAQFAEVRRTHRIGRTLDASWPSVNDVNYIVEKSSGQFIYAATSMRFILGSSASPKLSLDRVKGAEKFATHSPFPLLDAIYTYILSQAEDQITLKEVLQAHFLLMKVKDIPALLYYAPDLESLKFRRALTVFEFRCNREMIRSCLEDLTPLAKYTTDDELEFYHASFSDYILDESRSRNYFVDIPGLSSAIGLNLWKRIGYPHATRKGIASDILGLSLVMCMTRLPQGLMSILAPTFSDWTRSIVRVPNLFGCHEVLAHLGDLCIRDNDIADFRRFMREWLYQNDIPRYWVDQIKIIRFGPRYFQMTRAEKFVAPDDKMAAALYPESDFDRHESALWLRDLLHKIRKEIHPQDPKRYEKLLKAWISWACQNGIPCDGLSHLPCAYKYLGTSTTQMWPE